VETIAKTLEERALDKFLVIRIAGTEKEQIRQLAKQHKKTMGFVVRTFISQGLKETDQPMTKV